MKFSSLTYKIALSFLLALLILLSAGWVTYKNSTKIRNTVNSITTPQSEQQRYSILFKEIVLMDQIERSKLGQTASSNDLLQLDSLKMAIQNNLHSLQATHQANPSQLEKLSRLDTLLKERNAVIHVYDKLNQDYIKSDSIQSHINNLSSFINKSYLKSDTSKFINESKITTTTIEDTLDKPAPDKANLWNRLFGKKKEAIVKEVRYFVLEQMNVSLDTLQWMQDDSIFAQLTQSIEGLQAKRKVKLNELSVQRAALTEANTALMKEMVTTLDDLEKNYILELQEQNHVAANQIDDTLNYITILLIVFVALILVMGVLIARDIIRQTQNKKALILAKEEADRLGMVKQQFLSKMSHELRSPLQSIIGYTDLMQSDHQNDPHLPIVANASHHLLDIVNQILDYNNLIQDQIELVFEPFDLNQVLDELKALIAIKVAEKNLDFHWEVAPIHYKLIGDKIRLKQILLNLLQNAVKYTQEGSISFQTTLKQYNKYANVIFSIKDTGVGIPQEEQKRIFSIFEQLQTDNIQEGSGIGLSIVQELVDKMGGSIKLQSEAGSGSVFDISLQFLLEHALPTITPTSQITQLQEGTIWVVDDDPLILNLCRIILSENKANFQAFAHPQLAVEATIPTDLFLVFIDLNMPEIMGYDLVALLRPLVPPGTKMVAMTAQVLPDEVANMLAKGFDDVLMKPFQRMDFEAYFTHNASNIDNDEWMQEAEIIHIFQTETNNDLATLQTAMLSKDVATLARVLHPLASRLSQMGYTELGTICRKLELQIKNGKFPLENIHTFLKQLEVNVLTS